MLTAALEQCLEVQWADMFEVLDWDSESPPVCKELSQRVIEILKVLFNVTYSSHTQKPDEVQQIIHTLAKSLFHCAQEKADNYTLSLTPPCSPLRRMQLCIAA